MMVLLDINKLEIDQNIKWQLSYNQMCLLVSMFEKWASEPEVVSTSRKKLLIWSKSMRQLSEEVGRKWLPPEPDAISLLGFIARELEKRNHR